MIDRKKNLQNAQRTYDSRIDIYGYKKNKNELDEEVQEFALLKSTWANIIQVGMLEKKEYGKSEHFITHKIYFKEGHLKLNTSMKIKLRNRVFEIKKIIRPENEIEYLLECQEKEDDICLD